MCQQHPLCAWDVLDFAWAFLKLGGRGSVLFTQQCALLVAQSIMRSVLPGPMKYLGPLSTWLGSYLASKMSAKYEDDRSSASLEKA